MPVCKCNYVAISVGGVSSDGRETGASVNVNFEHVDRGRVNYSDSLVGVSTIRCNYSDEVNVCHFEWRRWRRASILNDCRQFIVPSRTAGRPMSSVVHRSPGAAFLSRPMSAFIRPILCAKCGGGSGGK